MLRMRMLSGSAKSKILALSCSVTRGTPSERLARLPCLLDGSRRYPV